MNQLTIHKVTEVRTHEYVDQDYGQIVRSLFIMSDNGPVEVTLFSKGVEIAERTCGINGD